MRASFTLRATLETLSRLDIKAPPAALAAVERVNALSGIGAESHIDDDALALAVANAKPADLARLVVDRVAEHTAARQAAEVAGRLADRLARDAVALIREHADELIRQYRPTFAAAAAELASMTEHDRAGHRARVDELLAALDGGRELANLSTVSTVLDGIEYDVARYLPPESIKSAITRPAEPLRGVQHSYAWTDLDEANSLTSWASLIERFPLTLNTADEVAEVLAAHRRAEQSVTLSPGQITA